MKQEQKQQAQHLYFQTDLSKAEIADFLGVSRSTLNTWASDNNWDRVKTSSEHMPSLVAENCYMVLAKLTENILSEYRVMRPITKDESITMRNVATTIKYLKNRSTVNENLEMMACFIDHVNSKDPQKALEVKPLIADYIASRAAVQPGQFMHPKFNNMGHIPATDASPSPWERAGERSEQQHWESNPTQTNTPNPGETPNEGSIPPSPLEVYPDPSSGRVGDTSPSPSEVYPDPSSGRAGERSTHYQEFVKQQTQPAKNKQTSGNYKHLNRSQRRELERQVKAANKQYPKAA